MIAGVGDSDKRIDVFLTERVDRTRSAVVLLIERGSVKVNGAVVKKNYRMKEGDEVETELPEPQTLNLEPQNIPIEIVYEDDSLLVVNKPRGMVVHPAPGNYDGTLVNALLWHCKDSLSTINDVIRPGIVHRIDKDTSGLLIVAKTDEAHLGLAEQIKEHSFLREYVGIVYGHLREKDVTVAKPIGRHPTDRKKMAVTLKNSKSAMTHYHVIGEYDGFSLVAFRLETGRTHQIRVHMASIGHAIYGDPVYSPKNLLPKDQHAQFLHAKKIGFIHPITKEYLEFDSEIPEYFYEILPR